MPAWLFSEQAIFADGWWRKSSTYRILISPADSIFQPFCSAFLFQVTCITDEGSAMTPVIKYSAGDGLGNYVKKLSITYWFYMFVVEIWYVVDAR